jgi:hypothetical protein
VDRSPEGFEKCAAVGSLYIGRGHSRVAQEQDARGFIAAPLAPYIVPSIDAEEAGALGETMPGRVDAAVLYNLEATRLDSSLASFTTSSRICADLNS